MQRDAIVQSLLDYHGSKVKTAESPGVSRATIYRKIHQYEIITPGQLTGHAIPYRLNLRTASCHRRRRVTLVAVDEHRQDRVAQTETLEQGIRLGRARLLPLVRLRSTREKVAEPVVLRVHPPTHHLHRRAHRTHADRW